jgi:hypothetical protein
MMTPWEVSSSPVVCTGHRPPLKSKKQDDDSVMFGMTRTKAVSSVQGSNSEILTQFRACCGRQEARELDTREKGEEGATDHLEDFSTAGALQLSAPNTPAKKPLDFILTQPRKIPCRTQQAYNVFEWMLEEALRVAIWLPTGRLARAYVDGYNCMNEEELRKVCGVAL